MKRLESQNLNVLFSVTMVLVMVLVIVMLVWRVQGNIKQYDAFQHQLMQKQAQVTAADVSDLVASIRNRMVAISLDNFFLKDFKSFKSVESLQAALQRRLKNYFPEMYAFTIADSHGEPLAGDINMLVGEICRADLKHTAELLEKRNPNLLYEPWVHPQPGGYHFDMMFPAYAFDQTLVFFMSFKAELLQEALNKKVFTKGDIYLLRTDKPGLIEVALQGVRNTLKRDLYLTLAEQSDLSAKAPVNGARWEVVVLPSSQARSQFVTKSVQESLILLGVFVLFWSLLFMFGLLEESRRGRLLSYLAHASTHDALTGLANRRFLYQAFKDSLSAKQFSGELAGLLYLDLNDFKPVNDAYGHEIGDELLRLTAQRLLASSRDKDVVARVGGDEFVVLLNNLGKYSTEAMRFLSETKARFTKHLAPEYTINQYRLTIQASMGVALLDDSNDTLDDLLTRSDQEMYKEKAELKQNK